MTKFVKDLWRDWWYDGKEVALILWAAMRHPK